MQKIRTTKTTISDWTAAADNRGNLNRLRRRKQKSNSNVMPKTSKSYDRPQNNNGDSNDRNLNHQSRCRESSPALHDSMPEACVHGA